MDIDEFLNRELTDLGLSADAEKSENKLDSGMKEDANLTQTLFADIKRDLTKANLDEAERLYNGLWNALLQQKLKWNKDVYEQISSLGIQFSSTLNHAYEELKNKSNQINELANRARNFLREGKKDMALKIYSQAQEINNSIPNVFFQEKRALQEQVTILYKDIVSLTDAELIQRVSSIMQQINQLIDKINSCILSNDIENASSNYSKCIELYNQVPEGFLRDKNSAGMRLLDIYRSLSINNEIVNLQMQLSQRMQFKQQPIKTFVKSPSFEPEPKPVTTKQQYNVKTPFQEQHHLPENYRILNRKKENAIKNIKRGFYNEAWKDIEEALQLAPNDVEAKALRAKIKTLQ